MGDNRLVYSTAFGRACPECGQPLTACRCKQAKNQALAGDGVVRLRRERGGRGGKTVTVINGLPLSAAALQTLAGELKRRCGTGGTVKDGAIEIQGDHLDLLLKVLQEKGYRAKQAGG